MVVLKKLPFDLTYAHACWYLTLNSKKKQHREP